MSASRKSAVTVLAYVVVAALLAGAVWLAKRHPIVEVTLAPEQMTPVSGHAYWVASPETPAGYRLLGDTNDRPRQSNLIVLRDGTPLGPAHTVHDTISKTGKGAFSHWLEGVYFSTPENTDPRSDGHVYHMRAEAVPSVFLNGSLAVTVVGLATVLLLGVYRGMRRAPAAAVLVKVAALAAVGVLAPWLWFGTMAREIDRLVAAGLYPLLTLYLAVLALALAGLAMAPFLSDWRIRTPLGLLLLLGFGADQVMLAVSTQHLRLPLMRVMWRERDMAGQVFSAYADAIWKVVPVALILAVAFLLPPGRWGLRARFASVPVLTLVAMVGVMQATGGRMEVFPSPFVVPAQLFIANAFPESAAHVDRLPVEYARPLQPAAKNIIMIVDESVRGDYLGLNEPAFDNTPFLRQIAPELANYGVATSASNCSVAARLILRVGLKPDQLPDTAQVWRRLPTIWQYAKKAGYKTVLVDAWRPLGAFHSYMDDQEARAIDTTLAENREPEYLRDSVLADRVLEVMRADEPLFVYVNKHGTHPDYRSRFPPTLDYDASANATSERLTPARRAAVTAYHQALRWSVDAFFEKLRPVLTRTDTIVIYTSDHGQSLFEGGYELSHCSLTPDLARGEVLIPLFVATGSTALAAPFKAEAQRAFGRASHFEIFPTLLELMGYAPEWVEQLYGPSLLRVPIERQRGFLMGTFFDPAALWLNADR